MAARSRWLVGSSSSSRSGWRTSTLASSRRPRSPPDSVSTVRARDRCRRSRRRGEALDARLELVAAAALVALLELAVAGELFRLAVAQLRLERHHLVVQALQVGERLEQRLEQRAPARQLLRLPEVGDRGAAEHPHVAAVGCEIARKQAQRGRLPGAVRSQQRQPIARTDQERGADQDVVARVGEAGVGELREGHRWICW